MKFKLGLILFVSSIFVGCATVPQADHSVAQQIKQLNTPSNGNAAIYVYRSNTVVGAALKKDVWVDGECLGETARGAFFHREVSGNQQHTISTESEFSPNHLVLNTESGKNYFIQQYIKPGVFVGGANLKQVDDTTGKAAILKSKLAQSGNCSKPAIQLNK
ncbi:MAG: DUF2846 domain-containing protein [Acinetobacter sp.]|nr:MAG: DUF2846 domain-containing protein [Acinetobacter sp.]